MAAAPGHSVCAHLVLKGNTWHPGKPRLVPLPTAVSAAEEHLSPLFTAKENNSICCLGQGSRMQPCTEHLLTSGAMLGVSDTMVWVLLWVFLTPGAHHPAEPSPDAACFTILSDTSSVFSTEAWVVVSQGMAPLTRWRRGHRSPPLAYPCPRTLGSSRGTGSP